jgi:phosphoserine phosphatase
MSCDAIVSDWNGTIIEYRDEKPLLEHIATDIFKASVPFNPLRMVRILRARGELDRLYREGRRDAGFDFFREMFKVYNEQIIRGTPASVIRRSVDRYAAREETQTRVDHRVLRPIEACHREGKPTGILSAGYKYGIERILAAAGHDASFDFCEADQLREDSGKAIEFGLSIYGRKQGILLKLLQDMDLDATRLAYIGDSEDDEGCFEVAGHPVVSLLAPDDLKELYAGKYGAFVPANERELADYLLRA